MAGIRYYNNIEIDEPDWNSLADFLGDCDGFNCLMMDPSFDDTAEVYNRTPYALLFLQQENPT